MNENGFLKIHQKLRFDFEPIKVTAVELLEPIHRLGQLIEHYPFFFVYPLYLSVKKEMRLAETWFFVLTVSIRNNIII